MHVSLTTFCSCPACGHCSICLSDFLQACGKAGQVDQTISLPNEWLFLFVFVLVPVIAERNEIPAAYREQLESGLQITCRVGVMAVGSSNLFWFLASLLVSY